MSRGAGPKLGRTCTPRRCEAFPTRSSRSGCASSAEPASRKTRSAPMRFSTLRGQRSAGTASLPPLSGEGEGTAGRKRPVQKDLNVTNAHGTLSRKYAYMKTIKRTGGACGAKKKKKKTRSLLRKVRNKLLEKKEEEITGEQALTERMHGFTNDQEIAQIGRLLRELGRFLFCQLTLACLKALRWSRLLSFALRRGISFFMNVS